MTSSGDVDAQPAISGQVASGASSSKKIIIKEIPPRALTECKVFALRSDMLSAFAISQDVLCLLASSISLPEELRLLFPDKTIHVEGPSVRKGEFNRLRTLNPTRLQLYGSYPEVVEGTSGVDLGLIAIDRSPESSKFARKVLSWSADRLRARNGFLLIRRYAYWRKARQSNEMVPVVNEFIGSMRLSMVGLALNGDGKPDVLIRVNPQESVD